MKKLLGKRILIAEKRGYGPGTVYEYKILEVSPSEKFVKVMDDNGRKYWKNSVDITPIEILEQKEPYPKV